MGAHCHQSSSRGCHVTYPSSFRRIRWGRADTARRASAQQDPVLEAVRSTLFGSAAEFEQGMAFLRKRGNPDVVPALLTGMRFARRRRDEIAQVMRDLTGQTIGTDWFDWMLWQERNPQIVPHPSLIPFKREVLLGIDGNFDVFLKPEYLQRDRMKYPAGGDRLGRCTQGRYPVAG